LELSVVKEKKQRREKRQEITPLGETRENNFSITEVKTNS